MTITTYHCERLFLFGLLVSMMIPLSLQQDYLVISTWNIPFGVLLSVAALRVIVHPIVNPPDIWEMSIIVFGAVFVTSTLIHAHADSNLGHLVQYLFSLVFAVYVRRNWNRLISPSTLVSFAIAALVVQVFVMMVQVATSSQIGYLGAYVGSKQGTVMNQVQQGILGRAQGTLGQANVAANWLVSLIPFVLMYARSSTATRISLRATRMMPLLVLMTGLTLFLSFSRGNIAIFLFLCCVAAFFWLWRKAALLQVPGARLSSLLLGACLGLGILVVGAVKSESLQDVQKTLQERVKLTHKEGSEGSLNYRLQMNKVAYKAFMKNPVLGVGYGNTAHVWSEADILVPEALQRRVHNIYLAFFAEGGLLCGILYLVILAYPLIALMRSWPELSDLKYGLFLSLLACSLFPLLYVTPTMPSFAPVHMLLLGSTLGYVDHARISSYKENVNADRHARHSHG